MSKRIIIAVLCVLSIFIIAGCSGIKSKVYNSSETSKLAEEIGKSNLSQEERGLFAQAVLREAFTGEKLDGKTVGEIISDQKKIMDEAAKKEQEEKEKAEALKKEFANYLTLTITSKESFPANPDQRIYSPYVVIKALVMNNGAKDVQGFKGYFNFKNMFGDHVVDLTITEDSGLAIGEKKELTWHFELNQFMEAHKQIAATDLNKLKYDWVPVAIVFKDGSTLGDIKQ